MIQRHRRTGMVMAMLVAMPVLMALAPQPVQGQVIDNDANAILLANRSKGLMGQRAQTKAQAQQQRRAAQGSPLDTIGREASCGGIAIGNVRPTVGDHRKHETTVIITGHVINNASGC